MTDSRFHSLAEAYADATRLFVSRLEQFTDESATRASTDGGWTPAQVGVHVALTNGLFSGVLTGAMPMAAPAPPGFTETFSFETIPSKIKTFPQLEPPATATRDGAIAQVQATGAQVADAIRAVPADWAGYCVTLPFGTLSMTQFAEFATRHVHRHLQQLDRSAGSN